MKAMAVVDYRMPLQPIEVAVPDLSPTDVLVRIRRCGVCASDLKIASGEMGFSATLPLPHIAGHEIVGEIVNIGVEAPILRGTRVVVYDYDACGQCPSCLSGRETTCTRLRRRVGFTDPGGLAEAIVVPWRLAVPLPDTIDDRAAAALPCAIATAYRAVVTRGRVGLRDRVLVSGAGGVGIHAAQLARARGEDVVATDPRPETRAAVEALGITAVDPAELAAHESASPGFDVVIETSGNPDVLARLVAHLRPGGRLVLVGYLPGHASAMDAESLVLKEIDVLGSRYATRADLIGAIAAVAEGEITSVVSEEFSFDDAALAFERVREGRAIGRVCVRMP